MRNPHHNALPSGIVSSLLPSPRRCRLTPPPKGSSLPPTISITKFTADTSSLGEKPSPPGCTLLKSLYMSTKRPPGCDSTEAKLKHAQFSNRMVITSLVLPVAYALVNKSIAHNIRFAISQLVSTGRKSNCFSCSSRA